MAQKRMFSLTIIDSDTFLDLPLSSQALYFHLSMRADDDGFINNPKRIQRSIGCNDRDLQVLIDNDFVIPFNSGIIVIKHWRMHNYIQKDRYKETVYGDEKSLLKINENNAYSLMDTECIQNVSNLDTQIRIDKIRLDKSSIEKNSKKETLTIPDEILEAWNGFVEMRKRIKKPLTDRAIKLAFNKLINLSNGDYAIQNAILDQSTEHCWSDLYPLKEQSKANNTKQNNISAELNALIEVVE